MTIKEHAKRFCYVVTKMRINGREWNTNSKFTSKDKAEKFIKEEKGFFSEVQGLDVKYEIVEI